MDFHFSYFLLEASSPLYQSFLSEISEKDFFLWYLLSILLINFHHHITSQTWKDSAALVELFQLLKERSKYSKIDDSQAPLCSLQSGNIYKLEPLMGRGDK